MEKENVDGFGSGLNDAMNSKTVDETQLEKMQDGGDSKESTDVTLDSMTGAYGTGNQDGEEKGNQFQQFKLVKPSTRTLKDFNMDNDDYVEQQQDALEVIKFIESVPEEDMVMEHDVFDEMGIPQRLLRGIFANGFERPSAIQQKAIVPLIAGHDLLAQAQSGTGKTATFSIGMLTRVFMANFTGNGRQQRGRKPVALALSPVRDLAMQSRNRADELAEYMWPKPSLISCVGGTRMSEDRRRLEEGVDIVFASPGRLLHMIEEGWLETDEVQMLILDECDVLLEAGFKEQLYNIFVSLPSNVQVAMFSATMPEECIELSRKFMRDPISILIKKDEVALSGIKQFFIDVDRDDWKLETILDLYEALSVNQSVIFAASRRRVQTLYDQLCDRDFTCSMISSDQSQDERNMVMKEFVSGSTRVLIATDIAARGIDAHHVSLVVNYDLPNDKENYIHRIGRAGRFGRKGVAINFVSGQRDVHKLRELEQFYDIEITAMPMNVNDYLS